MLLGIPIDFILFGLILLGVALFHRHTLYVALCGLFVISVYKIIFTGFRYGDHWVTHERCPERAVFTGCFDYAPACSAICSFRTAFVAERVRPPARVRPT